MADEQTQFINVIFDPSFTSFEQDLATLSLDKMMSIQYSEEILQKNFSVVINILKQLHRGMVVLNGTQKDNNEWIQKLRDFSQATDIKDRLQGLEDKTKDFATKEELHAQKVRFDKLIKDQDDQIRELNQIVEEQKPLLAKHGNHLSKHDSEVEYLNEEIEKLKALIKDQQNRLDNLPKPEVIVQEIKTEKIETQSAPQPQVDDLVIKAINDRLKNLEQQLIDYGKRDNKSSALIEIQEQPHVDLDGIYKRLDNHDEDVLRLQEQIDQLKKRLSEQGGGQSIDGDEILLIKNDIKKIFAQLEQLQTQLNLASFGGGGGNEEGGVDQSQMQIILAEFNKLRLLLNDFVTQGDFQTELQKINTKIKQTNEHCDEEIEKTRREFKSKIDKKAEQADHLKLVAEVNELKNQFRVQKRGSQATIVDNTPQKVQTSIDPDFMNNFNDLKDQVQQIEKESHNLKQNFNSFNNHVNGKIVEIEKKLLGFQSEKIFQELSALRDICDSLKKEQDQGKKQIKEFGKKIEQIMTREDFLRELEPKLKQVKDDMSKLIEDLKSKLDKMVDRDDLDKVQSSFLGKLEEVVQALLKQLANKQETKKALIYLEQKINQIFMILDGDGGNKDAEGLFAKKPALWSCASCDKELDKFKGQLGDYRGWAVFPPKETSPERMGRFGVGYKNMQEKQKVMKDKQEKERYQNENTKERPGSQSNQFYGQGQAMSQSQTNLPKITK